MSYQLSPDGTADAQEDVVVEADGVPFVVGAHLQHLLPGLRVEVRKAYGREGLVAWNTSYEPGGC